MVDLNRTTRNISELGQGDDLVHFLI